MATNKEDDIIWIPAKNMEELEKDLFEVMEETFPEFVWNGKLVKSTKYKCTHEDSVSEDDGTFYCPDCNEVFTEGEK